MLVDWTLPSTVELITFMLFLTSSAQKCKSKTQTVMYILAQIYCSKVHIGVSVRHQSLGYTYIL